MLTFMPNTSGPTKNFSPTGREARLVQAYVMQGIVDDY